MSRTINGKELKTLMLKNGKSLHESAKILGITVDEFKTYFTYKSFDLELIEGIVNKLDLFTIAEIPNSLTPAGIDLIDSYKQILELKELSIYITFLRIEKLYSNFEKYLPFLYDSKLRAECDELIRSKDSFKNECLEFLDNMKVKSDLLTIVDIPKSVTPATIELIKAYKVRILTKEKYFVKMLQRQQMLFEITERLLPDVYDSCMNYNYHHTEKYLKTPNRLDLI